MSTRIPLPGNMIDTLMNGVKTGSGMYTGIMNPILHREQQKQLDEHFKKTFGLQKAAAGRNASLFPLRQQLLQAQVDAAKNKSSDPYGINAIKAMEQAFGGQGGSPQGGGQAGDGQASYPALDKLFSGQGMFKGGEIEQGNIDLGKRPLVDNPETGGKSSVYSMSIGTPQGEVLISRVSDDGRILSEEEATDQFHKTGKHLGVYSSPEEATKAAQMIHGQQAQQFGLDKTKQGDQGGLNLDMFKKHPMLRGFFKHKFGVDPLASMPQTPEDKQAAAGLSTTRFLSWRLSSRS